MNNLITSKLFATKRLLSFYYNDIEILTIRKTFLSNSVKIPLYYLDGNIVFMRKYTRGAKVGTSKLIKHPTSLKLKGRIEIKLR